MSDLCKQSVTLCNMRSPQRLACLPASPLMLTADLVISARRFSDLGKTQSPPGHLWGSSMKSNEELTVL
jgi:hypothetical protein